MRARNVKPGFFRNEVLAELPFVIRLLFIGLWMVADREGRLEDRPKRIAVDIFPYDRDLDVEAGLKELERGGFILRYVVGDLRLIQVLNFKKHQSPHKTEKQSTLPAPLISVNPPIVNGEPTVNPPLSNGGNLPDSLIHRFSDSPNPDSPKQTSSSELKTSSDQASDFDESESLEKPSPKNPSREAEKLAELLKAEILRNKPDYRITQAQLRKWAQTADRILRLDGRSEERIAGLIRWVQRDEFWMANVLSMDTLREKFDQLELRRENPAGKSKAATGRHVGFEQTDYRAGLTKNGDGTFRL
jgi:hypothetical protein